MSYILQGSGALLGPCLSHLLGREVARHAPCICIRCSHLLSTTTATASQPPAATAITQRQHGPGQDFPSVETSDRPFFHSGRPPYRAGGIDGGPPGYGELRRRFPHAAFQQKYWTNFSAALPYLGQTGPVTVNLTFLCDPGVSHTGTYRYSSVLLIRDVYPGSDFFPSRIQIFSILDPGSKFFPSRIQIFSISDPGSDFFPSRI
jgi:hypothetical protein